MTVSWQAGSPAPGPRQVKDLNKAISALTWEGRTFTEVNGVVGGEERRHSYTVMVGPVRPEVTALDAAVRERFGCTVTRDNVREVQAAYAEALEEAKESRPVDDKRRTPDEDAEIKAKVKARDDEHKAQRDAQDALLAEALAKAPARAQALVVAQYNVDNSDSMTDYYSNQTKRSVAIGFRTGSREDFRQLHAAAAQFPETAGVEFEERRDNYSMGKGNYLSDHGWDGAGTGWVVRSIEFPAKWAHLTEVAIPDAPAPPEPGESVSADGLTVSPSSFGKPGVIELRFAGKPALEVREALKDRQGAAFRWAKGSQCWYGRQDAYEAARAAGAALPPLPETAEQREEVAV